jgi:hypothetical protein
MGVKSGRRVGLTTLPPSVSRMSENVGASTSRNPTGLRTLYRDNITFYVFIIRLKPTKIIFRMSQKCYIFEETLNVSHKQ